MSSRLAIAVLAFWLSVLACSGTKPAPVASGGDGPKSAATAGAPRSEEAPPSGEAPEPGGEAIAGKPRIGWPVPSSVKVRERLKKGEHVAELEYTLHACATRGGGFTIAHRAFRIVSLDGIPASDQRVAAAVDQLAPVTAAIPLIVVNAEGRFEDIQGLEEMMKGLEKAFPKKKLAPIRGLLSNPAQVQLLKQAAAFRWRAWAETWLSYDPALGRSHRVEVAAPVPGADRGAGELAFEGRTPQRAARLSASTKLEGNDAKRLVAAALAAVDVPAADLDSMKVLASYRVNVETEWPDIRPHRAKTEKLVRVDVDGTTREALESHDWVFDWGRSKNAKAECK